LTMSNEIRCATAGLPAAKISAKVHAAEVSVLLVIIFLLPL
jgi:hypothetical protein